MKIIIFGGIPKQSVKDLNLNDITGTSALYSYFLRKEFNKLGIETDHCVARPGGSPAEVFDQIQIPEGDHIISVAQRGFTVRCKTSKKLYENTRKAIKGKITSICDHATDKPVEDMIFYAVPYQRILPKNLYVGWACDHSLLKPKKVPGTISILIDHSYYGKATNDLSAKISKECLQFQQQHKEKNIIIRRFSGPEGVETVTQKNWDPGIYDRTTSMPYPKACEEYRKCDIFIVTHPESMGLSVLESAAAGAYILCPATYIRNTILCKTRNTQFVKEVPLLDTITSRLDIKKSIEITKEYNWTNITQKILKALGE